MGRQSAESGEDDHAGGAQRLEWRCAECGEPHERDEPPCELCGHDSFVSALALHRRAARRLRALLPGAGPAEAAEAADEPTATKWVCASCGREHPKHSPPCSRCGDMTLEQREVAVDPADLAAPSYLEMASTGHLVIFAVALLGAAVLGLGLVGPVELPGASGGPEPPDAPGNATAMDDGTPLATVETDYVATLNEERRDRDAGTLQRRDELDELATFYNRWRVKSTFEGGEIPTARLFEHLPPACTPEPVLAPLEVVPGVYEGAEEPGDAVGRSVALQRQDVASLSADVTGVDLHVAPDGRLYLTQILC